MPNQAEQLQDYVGIGGRFALVAKDARAANVGKDVGDDQAALDTMRRYLAGAAVMVGEGGQGGDVAAAAPE